LTFTRQFEVVEDDGEHDYYEQLQAEFQFELTADLEALGGSTAWWFADEGRLIDDYFEEVERSPGFDAVAEQSPTSFCVRQEAV
jgi:hypothetical protein